MLLDEITSGKLVKQCITLQPKKALEILFTSFLQTNEFSNLSIFSSSNIGKNVPNKYQKKDEKRNVK